MLSAFPITYSLRPCQQPGPTLVSIKSTAFPPPRVPQRRKFLVAGNQKQPRAASSVRFSDGEGCSSQRRPGQATLPAAPGGGRASPHQERAGSITRGRQGPAAALHPSRCPAPREGERGREP